MVKVILEDNKFHMEQTTDALLAITATGSLPTPAAPRAAPCVALGIARAPPGGAGEANRPISRNGRFRAIWAGPE